MSPTDDAITTIADKHGVTPDAVKAARDALRRGNGTMAQFSHPDFGGMAQWSKGGMSMVGDMFNTGMKARLDGVMADLVAAMASGGMEQEQHGPASADDAPPPSTTRAGAGGWPREFGAPSSSGSQNDMRYAFFPDVQRLIVEDGDKRTVYDTGSHRISGVSQQQSSHRDLSFTSQNGVVALDELDVVP